jgi:hypothetical protein
VACGEKEREIEKERERERERERDRERERSNSCKLNGAIPVMTFRQQTATSKVEI